MVRIASMFLLYVFSQKQEFFYMQYKLRYLALCRSNLALASTIMSVMICKLTLVSLIGVLVNSYMNM